VGGLTALAAVVVAYTLVASQLDRWWITGPMVFVGAGVILGPGGLDVLPFSLDNETILTITELTLALRMLDSWHGTRRHGRRRWSSWRAA
jgi:hypothetical protein